MSNVTHQVMNSAPYQVRNRHTGETRIEFSTAGGGGNVGCFPHEEIEILNYWKDEHPKYPASVWMQEVAEDSTRYGYWEWVKNREEGEQ